ncbi:MAG TPA: 2-phospho-L-lactate transferase [Gammaproteobacteria bacterium]|nr:2-phospho-L-lactate transferase [Gammaproteobacteria bacterium]|tara:strand:- start:2508 stop:3494 length:987 start_codon:yes stop_codon:yes gene_type:complete
MIGKTERYVAITGGVGGAKLCLGLAHNLNAEQATFVVNIGDDFEHLGLHISPDLDTLTYTLAGVSNPELGWGRQGETWNCITALAEIGGDDWFNLGDKDLAIHLRRTEMLKSGLTLTEVTEKLTRSFSIEHKVLPVSDDRVRTIAHTEIGSLDFQHYFVREKCVPPVRGFDFEGCARAQLTSQVQAAFGDPDLAGIIICPSNPFVSIDPMLAIPSLVGALRKSQVPVVAITPIVGGEAVKGPTAKIMKELDIPVTALAVAEHYSGLIDGFIVDQQDSVLTKGISKLGIETIVAQTVMVTLPDRVKLAGETIEFLRRLRRGRQYRKCGQ